MLGGNQDYGPMFFFFLEANPREGNLHILTEQDRAKAQRSIADNKALLAIVNGHKNIITLLKKCSTLLIILPITVAPMVNGQNQTIGCGHPDKANCKARVKETLKQNGCEEYYTAFLEFFDDIKDHEFYKALSKEDQKVTDFHCDVCDRCFSSNSNFKQHKSTAKHIMNAKFSAMV